MYAWSQVAERTQGVYQRAMQTPHKDTGERLARLLSLGPLFGPIMCVIIAVEHIFFWILEMWQPRDEIDWAESWSKEAFRQVCVRLLFNDQANLIPGGKKRVLMIGTESGSADLKTIRTSVLATHETQPNWEWTLACGALARRERARSRSSVSAVISTSPARSPRASHNHRVAEMSVSADSGIGDHDIGSCPASHERAAFQGIRPVEQDAFMRSFTRQSP